MATPYRIQVQPANSGLLKLDQNESTANKVSELLQKDLEVRLLLTIFLSSANKLTGSHTRLIMSSSMPLGSIITYVYAPRDLWTTPVTNCSQIPHHLLTLFGTGATADVFQKAYDENASYQIKASKPKPSIVEELEADYASAAPKYMGKGKHYASFLRFYQTQMESKGWEKVLAEYVFKEDDPIAYDMFGRLYAGFLHPLIQLMFGVEWAQPAIVAEALAQTAVHENSVGDFMTKAEQRANERNPTYRPFIELFEEVTKKENEKLAKSAHWDDANRIYEGVMARAPEEAIEYVSAIKVNPDELDERTAEMVHATAYIAAAAAWHPPNIPKMDFFLM